MIFQHPGIESLAEQATVAQAVLGLFAFWLVYYAGVFFYRLYLHPLARIPGPKLAASTFLVEFYHNIIKDGGFVHQIKEWHEVYGPVVRITPDEVHLSDPDHYDTIYRVGTKFFKSPAFYHSFGVYRASFVLTSNEAHRIRRSALSSFFSARFVLHLQDVIQEKVQKLEDRISSVKSPDEAFDLDCAVQAVAVDVITDYCYARPYNLLDETDFGRGGYFKLNRERGPNPWVNKQFPIIPKIAMSLPLSWVKHLNEAGYAILRMMQDCEREIKEIKKDTSKVPKHRTVFHQLLDPTAAEGYKIPDDGVLVEEAVCIQGAASETTGGTLGNIFWNVTTRRDVYGKLKTELRDAFPDPQEAMLVQELEKLPYLTACIREGLRLAHGVPGRLPRTVPPGPPVIFSGHSIPAGSSVSLSSVFVLLNPSIFPDPLKFDPDRWLRTLPDGTLALDTSKDRYFVPFSKGSRSCIGTNLAWSEMYIVLGRLIRRWEFEMHGSASKVMEYRDYFGGRLKDGEMGVQVRILGRSE